MLIPPPISVRHAEHSMIFSLDDEVAMPSASLLTLAAQAIPRAASLSLADISARMQVAPYYPDVWPGEHYRLLAAIVSIVKPKIVIEIGTATGLSALTIKKYLTSDAILATFDIQPWRSFCSSVLKEDDFQDNRLVQYTDDLR